MCKTPNGGDFLEALRFINEAQTPDDLLATLKDAGTSAQEEELARSLLIKRQALGGVFSSVEQVQEAGLALEDFTRVNEAVLRAIAESATVMPERANFLSLVLENPNYFGNLEDSPFEAIQVIQGNTSFEELKCVGLNPPFDRLEAVIQVKKNAGYSGGICSKGSREYVRFYVDLHDDGTLHDVGVGSVSVYDISGPKPLCYAVYLDFDAIRKRCQVENIVKVRAILSWNVPPPPNAPNHTPVWGNRVDVQVQIHPTSVIVFGDLLGDLTLAEVQIPDPIGPVVKSIDPESPLEIMPEPELSVAARKTLYRKDRVPAHRYAFAEVQELISASSAGTQFASLPDQTALMNLGLEASEIGDLFKNLTQVGDGNTSFEELVCIGLKPEQDLLEGVITLKKKNGYSGGLCSPGSTEFVAFWIDFGDGTGFTHVGTTSVKVHDLQEVPSKGLQYAVFLKTNLANKLIKCQLGARVVRVRAILSWQVAPPPGNPNWIPVWGNREECRIQLRPRLVAGHTPLIETVGDVGTNDINQFTGRATGQMVLASASLNQAPFGRGIAITGRIGNPPDSFGAGAANFKYKIEVAPDGTNAWQPLGNEITVKKSEFINGVPIQCSPGEFVCDATLTPTDDGDGLGPGWYQYIEDLTPPHQRFLVVDLLGRWETNANMEGLWKIRITAKDPATATVFPGVQIVKVRVDNTRPTVALAITSAEFGGASIPAVDCGKFPVGTIIKGDFSVHDPGTVSAASAFQHYGNTHFEVLPVVPAGGAAPTTNPPVLSFPTQSTTGVNGFWKLDTNGMKPCGYVIRMVGVDRTNVDSRGNHFRTPISVGFCLEEPE